MFRNRKLTRVVAVFFILQILFDVAYPTISYALTAGPTAPEATSFEPVDTTDMVNPLTGDFVYNIPLLEVPGPSGGFPLSLSYHAGILSQEEASWIGLGWTLNPGSINRNVNGFADDHKDATQNSRFFWEGGERHQADIGVTLGIAGVVGYSQGVSIGTDTYQGFGVGTFVSLGAGFDLGAARAGVGVSASVDPWGNPSGSVGVNAGIGNLSAGAGISTNFKTVTASASAGVSVGYSNVSISSNGKKTSASVGVSVGLVGASISTDGTTSMSIGGRGQMNSHQGNAGKMSTSSFGFVLPVPFVHLGYKYNRYWIDQMENVSTNGIFNNPTTANLVKHYNDNAYDSYSLSNTWTLANREDPDTDLQGTFAAYDNYNVNAQGITGNIAPHAFRQHLYRQNKMHVDGDDEIYDVIHQPTEKAYLNTPMHFRFVNDFSNRYDYDYEGVEFNTTNTKEVPLSYDFITSPLTGENGLDGIHENNLAGSKNVKHYTNVEIKNKVEGFKETVSTGFDRSNTPDEQIGGYQITNETGVTYHFSLPVYAQNEFYYSERIDEKDKKTFNYQSKPEKYAYTWLLTAITGPDYVDRGAEGFDKEDWGYWVEMEYGKWTDQYVWRTPGEGMEIDLDTDWKNYSEGTKELYYLDAIRTKTHTALFVKDIRDDVKSAIPNVRARIYNHGDETLFREELNDLNKEGSFLPKQVNRTWLFTRPGTDWDNDWERKTVKIEYTSKPVSSLKLSKIVLMSNDHQKPDKKIGTRLGQSYLHKSTTSYFKDGALTQASTVNEAVVNQHFPNQVLDVDDIDNTLIGNALRVIELETDNETLSMETVNSFSHASLEGSNIPSISKDDYQLKGKLTLKSLKFMGKEGVNITPPLQFNYDLEKPAIGHGYIKEAYPELTEIGRYNLSFDNANLEIGDIIKFNSNGNSCFASVYEIVSNVQCRIQIVGKNTPTLGFINWTKTKNPPYNKNSYDDWGMYKGDYRDIGNDHIDRIRTNASKRHVDAWSLRSIVTSLGSTIHVQYESDSYGKAALTNNYPLVIRDMRSDPDSYETYITVAGDVGAMDYFFDKGDHINALLMYIEGTETCSGYGVPFYSRVASGFSGMIEKIDGNVLTVKSKCLSEYFNRRDYSEEACYESYNPFEKSPDNSEFTGKVAPPPGEGDGNECLPYTIRYYKSGNLNIYNPNKSIPGGDLRVTSLSITDPFTETTPITFYDYMKPDGSGVSSGVTSYAPAVLDKYLLHSDYDDNSFMAGIFRYNLYSSFSSLISIVSEVPAPAVMYEHVKMQESIYNNGDANPISSPNYSRYHFEVFDEGMVQHEHDDILIPDGLITKVDKAGDINLTYDHSNSLVKNITLKDYTTQVGQVKSVIVYSNDGKKISETKHHFLHDNINHSEFAEQLHSKFKDQGKIQETFVDSRAVFEKFGIYKLYGAVSSRVRYPAIQTGQTSINYHTGISTITKNLEFDFYSGAVTKVLTKDSYGNFYISESTPAYRKYPGMGLAIYGYKNMLTQESSSYSYKVNNETDLTPEGLISASVQTWSDQTKVLNVQLTEQGGIWRKHKSYSFNGNNASNWRSDGLYTYTAFEPYRFEHWTGDTPNTDQWQKNSEITLYDPYSHALEAQDVNGNYAATKMDSRQEVVLATVANSSYNGFCFSSAEDELIGGSFGGDVKKGGGAIDNSKAHTGSKSIRTSSTSTSFEYTDTDPKVAQNYRASIWSTDARADFHYQNGTASIQTLTSNSTKQAGEWYLHNIDFQNTGSADLKVWFAGQSGKTIYWDDFRFHPLDAAMTSYVYNKWGELSYILDANNIYTKYEYDGMGRLKSTFRESFDFEKVKLTENEYRYALSAKNVITASTNGNTGYITPSGKIEASEGTSLIFSAYSYGNCSDEKFQGFYIDGSLWTGGSTSLADGTQIVLNGDQITLENVQGNHSLSAKFETEPNAGEVQSISCNVGYGGLTTGKFDYVMLNECGYEESYFAVDRKLMPPTSLVLPDCTSQNNDDEAETH